MILSGLHTLDETRELLAVAEYRFTQTEKAINEALTTKKLTSESEIVKDWNILLPKWKTARDEIKGELTKKALLSPFSPASIISTETEWKRILEFVQYQENVKGSLQDIYHRLFKETGIQVDFSKQPAQVAVDFDIKVLQGADKNVIKPVEKAGTAVKQTAGEVVTSNTGLIIGGTVVATLAAVVAAKIYLR